MGKHRIIKWVLPSYVKGKKNYIKRERQARDKGPPLFGVVREGLLEKEAFEWVQRVSQVNGWGKILPRSEVTFGTLEEARAVRLEHREGWEER